MNEIVCVLKNISKTFGGETYACKNINLNLRAGEVIGLVGENGAGKSTVVKCLYGFHSPSSGNIIISNKEVFFKSPKDSEQHGIFFIPQELDLFPELNIIENLFIGKKIPKNWIGNFNWKEMEKKADEIFKKLGVSFDYYMPLKLLSAANAKLVEIARALINEAKIIIMDEPTAALTQKEVKKIYQIINNLKKNQVSFIYISHRLDEIFELADNITVLRDGELIISDKKEKFTKSSLVQYMVGRPLEQIFFRSKNQIGNKILEVKNLSHKNDFKDVNLELKEGEIVGLAGLIGAGRSELAQTIFGLRKNSSGEIYVYEKKININSVKDAIKFGIAYLPEERRSQGLILPFTIIWNMTFSSIKNFSTLGYINNKDELNFVKKSSEKFTIKGAKISSPVSQLSGGNQQKVLVAKTIATNPKIIILDEPTRGVDVGAKAEIYKIIDDLANQGNAILLISSELNEVLSMSDRIYVMHEGRIKGQYNKNEFNAEKIAAVSAGVI